jgi:glutathione peroxidase
MKRLNMVFIALLVSLGTFAQNKTLHSFKTKTLEGEVFDLSALAGKKVLVVNTASKCGLTPQYEGLEQLYKDYGGDNFEIIGFPANNFLNQEPGNAEEIRQFCTKNYGVTFRMMHKISVKGDDIDPIYQWLTQKELNGVLDSQVKWNFQKYLIDENGQLVDVVWPKEAPNSEKIVRWITGE